MGSVKRSISFFLFYSLALVDHSNHVMKTPKRNLSFPLRSSLLIIALSATANAGEIPISGIEAFHQGDSLDGNGSVLKAIDGSGMDKLDFDDPSTWTVASTAWADDWQGFSSDNSGDNTWAVIDLGAPVASLSTMYLWNVEETNALDRGVKDFEVFHATSPTLLPPTTSGTVTPYGFTSGGWTAIGGSELKMGIQIGDAGQAYDLSDAAGARYIGLKLTSNHGGFRTGFAEVAFSDAADPDALTLGEPVPPDPPVDPPVGPIDGNVVPIAKVSAFHQGDSLDANGSVLKIADGSGMAKGDANDPSTWTISNTAWADDWQGFSADNSGNNTWAVLDLGAQTAGLDQMYLWNVQETNALDRGTSTFDVYYASSPSEAAPDTSGAVTPYDFGGGGWTQLSTGNNLAIGSQIGDPGEVFDISGASGARYIGLHLTANHGGFRTGLAEVALTVDPLSGNGLKILSVDTSEIQENRFGLTWYSRPGRVYGINYSDDLIEWTELTDSVPADADGKTTTFSYEGPDVFAAKKRFYQIFVVQ